ncbi:MAG TPA: hypothetical protein VGK74_11435 [Symbiobacteriaceae bacterium]
MHRVQQRNLVTMIRQATLEAQSDPAQAVRTLQLARTVALRQANDPMTVVLDQALAELQTSGKLGSGTVKTLKLGMKTLTERAAMSPLSPETIRRMTGI